ncbi:hypothetical protein BN2475_50119 [Paraburkholderia ribeironis]|uniref:Uncharacterized protein n=1 Tax=Paraburkholderia ribeironis TaxID=1247936 RepID=A0A1N7RKG7_9BURK|nr:hypothetical protein BN2475_50119 [Paraburkholderia ribeironis]
MDGGRGREDAFRLVRVGRSALSRPVRVRPFLRRHLQDTQPGPDNPSLWLTRWRFIDLRIVRIIQVLAGNQS